MYRPSQTVLEAEMAPSRRGEGAGGTGAPGLTAANGPDGGLVAIMGQKRQAHDKAIQVRIANHLQRKEKKRQDYAFWGPFVEKPSIIPGCPGNDMQTDT